MQRSLTTAHLLATAVLQTTAALPAVYLRSAVATQSSSKPRRQRMQLLSITVPLLVMERPALRNLVIFPSAELDSPTAANGTFINNGATVSGAVGGQTAFYETSSADSATLIANSGTGGGEGGQILFNETSTGDTSRIEVFGNGRLDVSGHNAPGVTIGSIRG